MDEKQALIEQIKFRLNDIKYQVEGQGFGGFVLNTLLSEERSLQDELNRLLNKSGVLSQTEADAIYARLRLEKKRKLENQTKRNILIIVGSLFALGALAYFTFKKPKQ